MTKTGACVDCGAEVTWPAGKRRTERCPEHIRARAKEYDAKYSKANYNTGGYAQSDSCGEGYDPGERVEVHLPAGWRPRVEVDGERPQEDGRKRGRGHWSPFSEPRPNEQLRFE